MNLTPEGIWASSPAKAAGVSRPGLILDRDGVLVEEVHYLHRREDVRLEPGIVELLQWARDMAIPVAVATNQAGIARGIFGWAEFEAVQNELFRQLSECGVGVDLVVACPFHPDHSPSYGERHAYWRKPGPGMLQLAASAINLDLSQSWMVGDNASDIAAAKAAGLPGAFHVLRGHGRRFRQEARRFGGRDFSVVEADDLHQVLRGLREAFPA